MSSNPNRSFVIFIPRIGWRSFLDFRFLLLFLGVILFAGVAYWWLAIRPYFWIHNARVAAFSSAFSSEAGRIVEMGPEVGEPVRKGELLFALDGDLARAMQLRLRYTIESLNEQARTEKLRLEKAMQDYVKASTQAEIGYEVSESLQKHFAILEEAQARSEKADRELQLAQAELAILELQEKKMRWEAPFDGIVVQRPSIGSTVSPGQPISAIYDPNRIWVEMEIPESMIEQAKLGALTRVRFLAFPKKEWKGKIFFISPSAENGLFLLKVSIEDKDLPLKPGLSAEVALRTH